jgi:hypothetical protein
MPINSLSPGDNITLTTTENRGRKLGRQGTVLKIFVFNDFRNLFKDFPCVFINPAFAE